MKRINYIIVICGFMLLTASCSKDEPDSPVEENNLATLSFGAVLNDLVDNKQVLKQALNDLPECSDATPSYVEVVLSGTTAVGSMENPLIVPVNGSPGDYDNDGNEEYFTMDSPDLELEPGSYSLDFFAVYDADENLMWIAPTEGGDLAEWVSALPIEFDLRPGIKKYVDVDVLCYDNRYVSQYGYLFFELEPTELLEFCLFGNICDEDGMHIPAKFRFDVWTYSGDLEEPRGVALFNENEPYINTVGINENGDAYADPLCVFLPDTPGEMDMYYGELSIIEENGSTRLIRYGEFSEQTVRHLFVGEDSKDYYHFREGDCNMNDSPQFFQEVEVHGPRMAITPDTNIWIYVDSSGSMYNTQYWLQWMEVNMLKDYWLSWYNNDEELFDEKVRVILDSSERTFDLLNLQGEAPEGDVIVLVFQNEAEYVYHSGAHWNQNTPRTPVFDEDITALRERLESAPANSYHGIIFQVESAGYEEHPHFADLITFVDQGVGNYSGEYGLSDRSEIGYVYDWPLNAQPRQIMQGIYYALHDMGFDIFDSEF